jgi:hypothetical protein
MLRDGKFIREDPIKIGSHYIPPFYRTVTKEDQAIQRTLMGDRRRLPALDSFDVGIYIVVFYVLLSVLLSAVKGLFSVLFG